uniref:CBM20 domain-containing protein n=1 Tax=Chromera velia CCMP2878 TaxID=1169474 RepID=A0A0G4HXI5_9ALVE|eukprot:Cvel_1504.t1-p1 / transcript=Cvel_1504.t1 / gene=Cvel_1504 / organism=Chromera_velia_CCMP2878 / gene_product=Zinc finger protein 283, putative / transcript_product=Zinc finger protein 283, putative / location=Cvel_scaffold52:156243-159063(-) / protein_length=887 / sequence_SO=supercontig / SO=protein_coding / is_pseudo=false
MEANAGGGVLFACTGVEPREGQMLVVVGSSSELGEWDASRGIALYRVKNPAFSRVWMSFPMHHSTCSQVRFQFALIESGSSSCDAMPLSNHGLTQWSQSSFQVTSALSAAASPNGRSQDCFGCVWEPLGCGPREVEVVNGGFALFGGRWGERETQVTPLAQEDMVSAQQHFEVSEHPPPSVSSEFVPETGREKKMGGTHGGKSLGGPFEGHCLVRDVPVESDSALLSASPLPSAHLSSSHRESGKGKEKGGGTGPYVQFEDDLLIRRDRVSSQHDVENANTLVSSAESAESNCVSVSRGRLETSADVFMRRQGGGVNGLKRGYEDSDCHEALRFAPASLKNRWGVGREEGDLLGGAGKNAGGVNGVTRSGGCDVVPGSGLLVGESDSIFQQPSVDGQWLCSSAACGGSKRRRVSSLSASVSEPQSDKGSRQVNLARERNVSAHTFPTVPQLQNARLPSFNDGVTEQGGGHETSHRDHLKRKVEEVGEGGEQGMDRSLQRVDLCLHGCPRTHNKEGGSGHKSVARSAGGRAYVNTADTAVRARSAGVRASVSTADGALSAKSAGGRAFVSTVDSALSAKSAGGRAYVNTADTAVRARSAGVRASVSTADGALSARSVEVRASVSMDAFAPSARSAGGRAYVNTADTAVRARSAGVRASVSTADGALSAKSAGGRAFVSTVDSALSAKSAGGRAYVNTADTGFRARSAEVRASVSTADGALIARSAGGRAFVSMDAFAPSARSVEGRAFVSTAAFALSARSAEVGAFVSTVDSALSANTAGGGGFVSTVVFALSATSAEVGAFVSMDAFAHVARSAGGRAFVGMVAFVPSAKSAEVQASVSTAASAHGARIAGGRAFVRMDAFCHVVMTADGRASAFMRKTFHPATSVI